MNWKIAWVHIVTLALALPLLFGLIPPNPLYGIRTSATLKDPLLWRSANQLWAVLAIGQALAFFAVEAWFRAHGVAINDRTPAEVVLLIGGILLTVAVVLVYLRGQS
jgi:uncharacterized membrane protein